MTRRNIAPAAALLVAGLLLPARPVGGDVLVTHDGTRHQGRVIRLGGLFVVTRPDGSNVTFTAEKVKEVIKEPSPAEKWPAMIDGADLADDAKVDQLADFAAANGLTEQRRKLLSEAYLLRAARAWKQPAGLRGLAAWSDDHDLPHRAAQCRRRADKLEFAARFAAAGGDARQLEALAAWCAARGLHAEVRQCLAGTYARRRRLARTPQARWRLAEWCHRHAASSWRDDQQRAALRAAEGEDDLPRLEQFLKDLAAGDYALAVRRDCAAAVYRLRAKATGNDAAPWVALARWCRLRSLNDEADQAEAAALRLAPQDPKVRGALGYRRDDAGKWLRDRSPWRLRILGTALAPTYLERLGTRTVRLKLARAASQLAQVAVAFEAVSAEAGANERFDKILRDAVPKDFPAAPEGHAAWRRQWARLFLASRVKLRLGDGTEVAPILTGQPAGDGFNLIGGARSYARVTPPDEAVLQYVRTERRTVLLVRPGKTVGLVLMYEVPRPTARGKLAFYDRPPVEVRFEQP